MAKKIKTALPPHLDLSGAWVIEWDAVDPTTGDSVAGVVVSDTSLVVEQSAGPPITAQPPGSYILVPGPAG